jgi:beta-lactam-binding protein with PASTA domain
VIHAQARALGTGHPAPVRRGRLTLHHGAASSARAAVPDLTGLTLVQAGNALRAVGLALGHETEVVMSDCIGIGIVQNQGVAPGTLLQLGSAINFSVGVRPSGTHVCQ